MFKNLRTSSKLVILCGLFIITIAVTTYSLLAEKQIAINFARKELLGTEYLVAMRNVYAGILSGRPFVGSTPLSEELTPDIREALSEPEAADAWRMGELTQRLAESLARLSSGDATGDASYRAARDVLEGSQQLVSRIADESNLTLDPDIDTYYLQDLIARKLPTFYGALGEVQVSFRAMSDAQSPSDAQRASFSVREELLRSAADEVNDNLGAAYRGSPDGSLKTEIDDIFSTMASSTNAYLETLDATLNNPDALDPSAPGLDHVYGRVVENTISAWTAAQSQLAERLQRRIDGFIDRRRTSLALIGVLIALSVFVAVMTHRHTVRPLERLEHVAEKIGETKDYELRVDYAGTNEIGKLAATFNDMLSELAAAREREASERSELARVSRLTTMGQLTASLAHEINQPLAAIVANSRAAERWLSASPPDIDEARSSLKSIANDGHRASDVIGSVRAMFQKDSSERSSVDINEVIRDVLALLRSELHRNEVLVQTDFADRLPALVANRVQLQQVLLNLIMNAVEAMSLVDRARVLVVRSEANAAGEVIATVEDSGPGISPDDQNRLFEAFFTTKSTGMGLGLSICRSIVESHGGRLTAVPAEQRGTVFQMVLPGGEAATA